MKKRYAIVRVDNKCPLNTEDNFYCSEYLQKDKCKKCKEIRGDTKEQLIKKVAQALELCMNKGYRTITSEEYAKEIVEFLGVK